jgi:hypothetical protein
MESEEVGEAFGGIFGCKFSQNPPRCFGVAIVHSNKIQAKLVKRRVFLPSYLSFMIRYFADTQTLPI